MPELPEVETIRKDLEKVILSKKISNHKILLKRTFHNEKKIDFYGKIADISRVGKYLVISIEKKCKLLIHLRMTGKLIYINKNDVYDQKHVKVIFYFSGGDAIIFHDVRTFGIIEVLPMSINIQEYKKIGCDALSHDFHENYLKHICDRKIPIKNLLLDQSVIAGIGNIYAQEILFMAKISPIRIANTLSVQEIKKIIKHTKKILNLALIHNGTSISDFRRVDDKTGEFQNFLKVYGKAVCPICDNKLIIIKQGGRTTRYCDICQH